VIHLSESYILSRPEVGVLLSPYKLVKILTSATYLRVYPSILSTAGPLLSLYNHHWRLEVLLITIVADLRSLLRVVVVVVAHVPHSWVLARTLFLLHLRASYLSPFAKPRKFYSPSGGGPTIFYRCCQRKVHLAGSIQEILG
jgi:hypothetical protein